MTVHCAVLLPTYSMQLVGGVKHVGGVGGRSMPACRPTGQNPFCKLGVWRPRRVLSSKLYQRRSYGEQGGFEDPLEDKSKACSFSAF